MNYDWNLELGSVDEYFHSQPRMSSPYPLHFHSDATPHGLRVPPANLIPTDGTPYELIPIDPQKVGGGVACDLVKADPKEGGDIHTNVQIGPQSSF